MNAAALYGRPMIPGYTDVSGAESARMPESPNAVKPQLATPTRTPALKHAGVNGSGGHRSPSPPDPSRPMAKLKRFLATLQQFGADISPDTGERMHALILGLASSTLPIEEFHQKVQDLTNYPLRPFVVPFLKANLPLLQTDLVHGARLAHQTPQQYARQHLTLDAPPCGAEPADLFQTEAKDGAKRRTPPDTLNGFSDGSCDGPPPGKRQQTLPSPTLGPRMNVPPGLNLRYDDALYRYDRYDRPYYGSVHRDFSDDRDMEDEWKNIHTMLNCILGMVEKTKRALSILQHRSHSEAAPWRARHLDATDSDLKKRAADVLYKPADDRRRNASSEVLELQKAAELKASELLSAERAKMERLLGEARRQAAEETLAALNHQEESTESCWNCGRKANETCSGCNVARYCGAFCQHKDWENHHRACGATSNHASPSSSPGKQSPVPPSRTIGGDTEPKK